MPAAAALARAVLSAALGALWGAHLRADVQALVPPIVLHWRWVTLARFGLGVGALVATRAVVKALALPVMTALVSVARGARPANPKACYAVELPTKFFTYTAVGLCAVYAVPLAFEAFGLSVKGAA